MTVFPHHCTCDGLAARFLRAETLERLHDLPVSARPRDGMWDNYLDDFRDLHKEVKEFRKLHGVPPPPQRIDAAPLPPLDILSRLPPDSPWKSLDFDALANDVVRNLAAVDDVYSDVMDDLKLVVADEVKILETAFQIVLYPYRLLRHKLEDVLDDPDREHRFREDRQEAFRRFPRGEPPEWIPLEALPAAASRRLTTVLFPRLFPFIRRVLFDFSSTRRRNEFGAWAPLDDYPSLPSKLEETDSYWRIFSTLRICCIHFAYDLLADSGACRRRMADDAGFLDALALGVVCGYEMTMRLRKRDPEREDFGSEEQQRLLSEIMIPVQTVLPILAADRRPWRARGPFQGPKTAAGLLFGLVALFAKRGNQGADGLGEWAGKIIAVASDIAKDTIGPSAMDYKKICDKKGSGKDSCDACGREVDKLLRCARCRVGRYCSADCQKATWVDGKHKSVCFPITFPHPDAAP